MDMISVVRLPGFSVHYNSGDPRKRTFLSMPLSSPIKWDEITYLFSSYPKAEFLCRVYD